MVASVSACMTRLNMAITWLAMADTIAESGWGTGGGIPEVSTLSPEVPLPVESAPVRGPGGERSGVGMIKGQNGECP